MHTVVKKKTNTFFCYVLVSYLVRGEKGILLALVDIYLVLGLFL